MEYIIRRGKIEDLKKIISLTKRAYEVPYKEGGLITKSGEPKNVEEIFKNKGFFVLIAEHNNRIIGAIRYRILEDNNLYIYKFVVSKKYRNKGIAKSMREFL